MLKIAYLKLLITMFIVMGSGGFFSAKAELPSGVIAIERQLNEWREISAFWVEEVGRAHPTNQADLAELKLDYIHASAIANSLIDQLQLQIVSGSSISPKDFQPNVERAKMASEALAAEGKRLLLAAKSRGKSRGANVDYDKIITDNAAKTISLAGGLMDILDKHKKAFTEVKAKERDEVNKLLEKRRWKPLKELLPTTH